MNIKERNKREAKIIFWFTKRFYTMQMIGDKYGLTRERVRQILGKYGIKRNEGGYYKASRIKKENLEAKKIIERENKWLPFYGCTNKEFKKINKGPYRITKNCPAASYSSFKRFIERRETVYLTLPQWVKVWKDSGHWRLKIKGKGKCKYIIAKIIEEGKYSFCNVHVIPFSERVSYVRKMEFKGLRPRKNIKNKIAFLNA